MEAQRVGGSKATNSARQLSVIRPIRNAAVGNDESVCGERERAMNREASETGMHKTKGAVNLGPSLVTTQALSEVPRNGLDVGNKANVGSLVDEVEDDAPHDSTESGCTGIDALKARVETYYEVAHSKSSYVDVLPGSSRIVGLAKERTKHATFSSVQFSSGFI